MGVDYGSQGPCYASTDLMEQSFTKVMLKTMLMMWTMLNLNRPNGTVLHQGNVEEDVDVMDIVMLIEHM